VDTTPDPAPQPPPALGGGRQASGDSTASDLTPTRAVTGPHPPCPLTPEQAIAFAAAQLTAPEREALLSWAREHPWMLEVQDHFTTAEWRRLLFWRRRVAARGTHANRVHRPYEPRPNTVPKQEPGTLPKAEGDKNGAVDTPRGGGA
jgi:hypothetical protein